MQIVKVHVKIDKIIEKFTIVNPTNLVMNYGMVNGDIVGPDGVTPVQVRKVIVHFPNLTNIATEESMEELLQLFGDTTKCQDSTTPVVQA